MDRKIKLNLGCGSVYKPGYINIDRYDDSVADKTVDIADLPFESNSVDLIEASQVIEHFDYVHCKYVLSEWFRILRPQGTLALETPDLEKTFKKFVSGDLETQKTTLQWIYGIDSLGLQHKAGFTFNLLRNLLEEIGFEKILRKKPRTHRYEPGMRIVCRKPKNYFEKQLFACFRNRLKNKLRTDSSYVLIPLENWLRKIFDSFEEFKKDKKNCMNRIISKTVVCNPIIPLAFLEECIDFDAVEKTEITDKINLLNHLAEAEFHKKVFSLWMKSKKELEVEEEFKNFVEQLEFLVLDVLSNQIEYKERLKYITSLDPADIELFDFCLVLFEAKKLFNTGAKYFHKRKFSKALSFFLKSSKINPGNLLVYWNMARLGCILKLEKHKIIENYEKALGLVKNRKNRKELGTELKYVRNCKNGLIQKELVSENYQKT